MKSALSILALLCCTVLISNRPALAAAPSPVLLKAKQDANS
jgi:hypothetical protein